MKTKITDLFRTHKALTAGFMAKSNERMRRMATATLAVLACVLVSWPAAAATINWGAANNISGDTDVTNTGTALYAYTGGTAGTVNGVSFTAGAGNAAWGNVSFTSGFSGSTVTAYAPITSIIGLSQTYSNLLAGGAYGGATAGIVTLNGLTPNEAYAVQIWVNDPRSAGVGRYEIASNTVASASTATLLYNNANALGNPGQYVVGIFLADSTSQSFTLIPSGGSVQLNAVNVRHIGGPNKIWLGSSDTSWGTGANWSPSGVLIAGQSVVFNNLSTANLSTVLDVNYTVPSVTVSNASAVVIGNGGNGSTLTLSSASGINLVGSSQSLDITAPIVLGASQYWTLTNNSSVVASGGISGSGSFALNGGFGVTNNGGTVTFDGPQTFTGNCDVNSGKLVLTNAATLAAPSIRVNSGSTLDVSAVSPTFTLNAGQVLTSFGSLGSTLNGSINASVGTLYLRCDGVTPDFYLTNGTLTLSGSTVISINNTGAPLPAGTNTIISAATSGNVGAVAGTLPTLTLTGNGAVGAASLQIDVSGNLNLVIATPHVWTGNGLNGLWTSANNWSPLSEPGVGDAILFNSSSINNLSSISQNDPSGGYQYGVTVLNPAGPVTIGGPNTLAIYDGGLNLAAASQNLTIAAPLVINANQTWLITNSRNLTVSGSVSSSSGGNVTVSGGGTVQLGAAHLLDLLTNNAGTCDFTVNGGKLDLNGHSQAMNGLSGSTSAVVDNSSASPVTLVIGGNGDGSTNNGVIQNSGGGALALQVNGGDVQLLATNTYSGGTIFNGGRLFLPNSSALSTGPVAFNPGSGAFTYGVTFTNALTLNLAYLHLGGGGYPNLVNQTWSGPVTVTNGFSMSGDNQGCTLTLSGPMNIGTGGISVTNFGGNGPQEGYQVSLTGDLLSGTISGSGGITYNLSGGNSRLTVQGANTYTGGTIVNGDPANPGGKLNVAGGINPFSTGSVTLNTNAIIEAAPGSGTVTNALVLNGGTLQSEPQFNNYNTLTWSGPITLTADSTLVQNATGALNSDQSSGVNVSGSLNMNGFTLTCSSPVACYGGNTISGPISGAGIILENGNNTLTISGSNTFSGTFRSVLGTLSVKNPYALQKATLDMDAADAGAVSINTNVIIGALTGSRDLNLGSFTDSIGNNNASTTFSGALTNTVSLVKVGSGTLTLSGASSLPGNTTVSNGTLSLSQSPFAATSTVKVAGGAFLNLNYIGTTTVAGLILNGVSEPTGLYNSGNSGGLITGTGALQVNPPNAWIGNSSTSWNSAGNWAMNIIPGNGSNAVFNFYSTANLATVLNANFNLNTLTLANPSGPVSIAAGGAYALTLTNGIDLSSATQPLTITAPVVMGSPQTWSVANISSLTVNGSVSGADVTDTLTVSGGGIVSLGGTNTYSGTTTISAGTLQIGGAGELGSGSYAGNIANSATLKYSSSANQILSGTISGNGSLIKDTASTSTLTIGALAASARNNGGTTVSAGTLTVNSAGSLYSTSAYQANSTVTVNSGATLSLYAWAYGAAGSIGASDLAATHLRVNGGTLTYTGVGEGSGSGNNGRLFTIGTGGATLDAEGTGTWFLEASSGYDGAAGQVIPSTLTLTLAGANNGRYGKLLSGAGSLVKSGAGTWTLAGNNTYTGATTVSNGTLSVTGGYFSTGTTITVASGATLAISANNGFSGGGTGQGGAWTIAGTLTNSSGGTVDEIMPASVTLNNGTLGGATYASYGTFLLYGGSTTITANGSANTISTGNIGVNTGTTLTLTTPLATDALTLSGYIGGTSVNGGSVTKSGSGTVTLSGANTYTGATTVNAGTLLVNNASGSGTGAGAVKINNGGTLGGIGTISGLVTNLAGGTLYPGTNGIGKLTLNGNVTLLAGSTNTFLVNGSTAVASNSVAVGAAITYGGVLNIVTSGTFTIGQTFTLFSGAGATSPSSFVIAGNPGPGKAFSFANGVLSVVSSVVPNPVINSVTLSGSNLILQGTNGAPLGTYAILTSTNVALPLSSWTTNSTGTFTASGAFSNAIPVTSQPQWFFDIKQP